MREVIQCERSTITEAWGFVVGRPAALVPQEAEAIVLHAKRALVPLVREPAVVLTELPASDLVQPFWNQQWSWDAGRFRARVGHRYLSVHCLASESRRYDTYAKSLAPAVAMWLNALSRVHAEDRGTPSEAIADQLGFGYINEFDLPSAGFDLSEHFHVDVGIQPMNPEIDELDVHFAYRKAMLDARVVVDLGVRSTSADRLSVKSKIVAIVTVEQLSFANPTRLEQEIGRARAIAKQAFFSLATPSTHERMGTIYGDSNPT